MSDQTDAKTDGNGGPTEAELRVRSAHKLELAKIDQEHDRLALAGMPFAARMYFDAVLYDRMMLMADRIAASASMPKHIRGDPVMALYCIERGWSWRMSPLAIAMGTFKIGDSIGHFGRVIIAAINGSGYLDRGLTFEHFAEADGKTWAKVTANFREENSRKKQDEHGNPVKYLVPGYNRNDEEGLGVIVRGHIKGEVEPRELRFYLKQAWPRNSTLWATDPATQLCYTAARRFGNIYTPEIVAGVRMDDDFERQMVDVTPQTGPQGRTPAPDPAFVKAWDAYGSEYAIQQGEIADWLEHQAVDGDSGIGSATPDEIDALVSNNADEAVSRAIDAWIADHPRGGGNGGGKSAKADAPQSASKAPPAAEAKPTPKDTSKPVGSQQRPAPAQRGGNKDKAPEDEQPQDQQGDPRPEPSDDAPEDAGEHPTQDEPALFALRSGAGEFKGDRPAVEYLSMLGKLALQLEPGRRGALATRNKSELARIRETYADNAAIMESHEAVIGLLEAS